MGIPYVIYWKDAFSTYVASHFRHALLSVVQSSSTHTWDAFQLAHASFRLYCVQNNHVVRANYVRCIFKKSKDAYKDALAAIRGGRIPPPESMPSFEEVKEVLGFNSYYEVVYTVFNGQLKMQNQKYQSPQDPIVEVITPEVYDNYGADGFKDSFSGMQLELQKESKKLLKGLFILVLGSL
ncbi:hypothetical protein ABKV19_010213 [Rosa sericea]